ncbi:hypothetical protein BGZ47_006516 [Haplosporangium gracile]|nr:hypothetical protein BGZ47_006516 [Haplosporangium gracile]
MTTNHSPIVSLSGSLIDFSLETLEIVNNGRRQERTATTVGGMECDTVAVHGSTTPLPQQQRYNQDVVSNRASGATISQAVSRAWHEEEPHVQRLFEYDAELERAQQASVNYQYRKRKSKTLLTSSTDRKGSTPVKTKSKAKASKAKAKAAKAMKASMTTGSGTTAGSGSGSRSGSGSGSDRSMYPSSSLGFGLRTLSSSPALLSSLSSLSSSQSLRLASVLERDITDQGHTSQRPLGDDSVALAPKASEHRPEDSSDADAGVEGRLNQRTTNISTTPGVTASVAGATKARKRSKSKGGSGDAVVLERGVGHLGGSSNSQNDGSEGSSLFPLPTHSPVIPLRSQPHQHLSMFSTGAFARMQIRENGAAQDQDDVIMFHYHSHSQSHLGRDHQEQGEGEGEGEDDHNQNEDGVELREDQAPVKKRKSL